MLKLVVDSYKLFAKNIPFMLVFALPLLVLSAINIYFRNFGPLNNGIIYFTYASFLILPFVSAATDICIYRRLFRFNIINPLSSLHAFILYLLAQIGIGLIGTAPIFLLQYIFTIFGMSPIISLTLAVVLNIFAGFAFMARFNIVLPLIIQNKVPSLRTFLNYTKRPYVQWLQVAALVYLPYVVIHYLTLPCPYTNMVLTTIFMFVFIGYNVTYINNNRLSRVTYQPSDHDDTLTMTPALVEPVETKKPAAAKPAAPKKAPTKKPANKTPAKKAATPKKAPKKSAPKLKPVMAKV